MSRPDWHTHAHAEAVRKVEAPGALATAEQHIRKVVSITTRDRLAKMTPAAGDAGVTIRNVTTVQTNAALPSKATPQTVNSDGLPTKPTVPAIMGTKKPIVLSGGSPILAGADRSRTPASLPASTADHFAPVADMAGVLGMRPGEIEHLAAHGIVPGIVNGVLSIKRDMVPAATGIILQARGGR